MMGPRTGQQDRLFYEFNIEDRVPSDHLLRRINAVLDLSWVRSELSSFYSHTGSVPGLYAKSYLNGIFML